MQNSPQEFYVKSLSIFQNLYLFIESELIRTETEEKLMASAPVIGLRNGPPSNERTPAATGMPIILYIKAKNKFCRIFRII